MKFYFEIESDGRASNPQALGHFKTFPEAEQAAYHILRPLETLRLYVPEWHFSIAKNNGIGLRLVRTLVSSSLHRVSLLSLTANRTSKRRTELSSQLRKAS